VPALGRGGAQVGVPVGRPMGVEKGAGGRQWWAGVGPVAVLEADVTARQVWVGGSPTRSAWWRPGGGVGWWCQRPVARPKWPVLAGGRLGGRPRGGRPGSSMREV
jgi:hypothetical protein